LARAVCATLLTALALGFGTRPVAAQSPGEVHARAEDVIRRLDLQTELPHRPEPLQTRQLVLPEWVLWVVIIVGVGALLYAFRDMIPMLGVRRDGAWEDEEGGAAGLAPRAPEAVLGVADDLAAEGRFVEAMHVLLLQALAAIRRRLDEQFADSMTSREILRSRHLSDDLRRPLRDVVSRVEWTYFGEHPAVRDDYLACRASFAALANVLQGSAAA
jgi:hypothetical protein